MRKNPLVNGHVYHIISRSIAGYKVFPDKIAYRRFINTLQFYNLVNIKLKFSKFDMLTIDHKQQLLDNYGDKKHVDIVCFSIMPTHIHLVVRQCRDNGIFVVMRNLLNSYSRYFNTRFRRKGPLWDSHFNNILVADDDQLLHLTRYVHLNPVSAGLVDKPEGWIWSSYREYIGELKESERICNYKDLIDINQIEYQKFVNDRISYQKEISKIKRLLLDDYSG